MCVLRDLAEGAVTYTVIRWLTRIYSSTRVWASSLLFFLKRISSPHLKSGNFLYLLSCATDTRPAGCIIERESAVWGCDAIGGRISIKSCCVVQVNWDTVIAVQRCLWVYRSPAYPAFRRPKRPPPPHTKTHGSEASLIGYFSGLLFFSFLAGFRRKEPTGTRRQDVCEFWHSQYNDVNGSERMHWAGVISQCIALIQPFGDATSICVVFRPLGILLGKKTSATFCFVININVWTKQVSDALTAE